MKQLNRWMICLLLFHIGIFSVQGSKPILTHGTVKFGVKLGYQVGIWSLQNGLNSYFPIELFIAYHGKTIDKGPSHKPLFGFFGNRYESFAIQGGVCYRAINMHCMRNDIEPEATFFQYHEEAGKEMGAIACHIKTLSLPIVLKSYIGKTRKFCITTTIAPLFVLSIYKKDWIAEWANQPEQGLLKKRIYTVDKQNTVQYNDSDPNHKRDRTAFYNKWIQRPEKDQCTYLSPRHVLNGRIGWEVSLLGIEYETDRGFIVHWDIAHFCFLSKRVGVASSIFSIGYNFHNIS